MPGPIEDIICRSHFIQQTLLYGDNKEYNVILVVPDFPVLRQWVVKNVPAVPFAGANPENDKKLIGLQQVQDLISAEVSQLNQMCFIVFSSRSNIYMHIYLQLATASGPLKSYERPQKWAVILEPFSPVSVILFIYSKYRIFYCLFLCDKILIFFILCFLLGEFYVDSEDVDSS